jgi:ATP-dependent Clp protease adaptor protein ClpS
MELFGTQSAPEGDTALLEAPNEAFVPSSNWVTIVWDDPVNLMSYVTYVFSSYFGFAKEKAEVLMLKVHTEGKAVVSSGCRERMERDVAAMQNFGLWSTMEREN